MHVTPTYILEQRKQTIKKYKKKWKTDLVIKDVAVDVTQENVDDILEIMVDTGYTFNIAYMVYKYGNTKDLNIISMSDITIPLYMTTPKSSKVNYKIDDTLLRGIFHTVVLSSEYELIDGYATLLALKRLGDRFIIYEIDDYHVTKQRRGNSEQRFKLYEKQNGKCYICGRSTKLDSEHKNDDDFATVDHIIPVSKGGSNRRNNVALCCKLCNNLKGNFRYSEDLKKVILMELKERNLIKLEDI